MSGLFKELKAGLEEALDYAKKTPRKSTRSIKRELRPLVDRTPAAIRKLRMSLGKTQEVFAQLIGVSKKTVEAWEAGTKKPNGSVLRLFQVLEHDLPLLEEISFGDDLLPERRKVGAAEFERDLIVERTKAGLAAARSRGKKGGRPHKMDKATLKMAMSAMSFTDSQAK